MKASSRSPEVEAVRQVLSKLGFQIVEMKAPAQLDGGDVLIMHGIKEIWVHCPKCLLSRLEIHHAQMKKEQQLSKVLFQRYTSFDSNKNDVV